MNTIYEKTILSPFNSLCFFVKDLLPIFMGAYYGLSSLFHGFIVYSLVSTILSYFKCIVNVRSVSVLWLYFSSILLAILGLLPFHRNFRISLSVSTKSFTKILIRLCWIYRLSGEKWHLTILSLPIHEYRISVHVFRSFLISVIRVL